VTDIALPTGPSQVLKAGDEAGSGSPDEKERTKPIPAS